MENQERTQNNGQGFAITGLVTGIVALLLAFIPCFVVAGILLGTAAVVFGAVALSRANANNQPKGMSIAGLSLGSLAVLISIVWIVSFIGAKGKFQDHFKNAFEWVESIEDLEDEIEDEFNDIESLDELEKALDELEGVIDEVNEEVNEVVKDVHIDVKDALDDAREEIKEAKEQINSDSTK